jgi:hypothetical protein
MVREIGLQNLACGILDLQANALRSGMASHWLLDISSIAFINQRRESVIIFITLINSNLHDHKFKWGVRHTS